MSSDRALALPYARREQAASHYRALGVPQPPDRGMEIFRSARRAGRSRVGRRHGSRGNWARCPTASKLFDLADADAPDWVKTHLGIAEAKMRSAPPRWLMPQGGLALRVSQGDASAAGAGIFRRRPCCAS